MWQHHPPVTVHGCSLFAIPWHCHNTIAIVMEISQYYRNSKTLHNSPPHHHCVPCMLHAIHLMRAVCQTPATRVRRMSTTVHRHPPLTFRQPRLGFLCRQTPGNPSEFPAAHMGMSRRGGQTNLHKSRNERDCACIVTPLLSRLF